MIICKIKSCWILAGIFLAQPAFAQIRLFPAIFPEGEKHIPKNESHLRKSSASINLPFWDDFSTTGGTVDTSLWMEGSGVYVNNSRAVNPPTLGVATFDGLDANGGLYDVDPDVVGLADSLVSKPIDLGTLSTTEVNSVYLSFFWEHEGAQELPDPEDSLRLLFKDFLGNWIKIDLFTTEDVISSDTFVQVIYQVKPEFLHSSFQFKFEEFGRLSGAYDAWHIDYVYLNKNRQVNNRNYFDRAISTVPASLFKGYSAIPKKQFFHNPGPYISNASVSIYNLDKIFQPIEFTALVTNRDDPSQVFDIMNFNTPLNPILQGQQRRTLTANPFDFSVLDADMDSIYLKLKFYISSGDSIQPGGMDYRINDTTSADLVIHNYFAYDDGTAEFGAGLDQRSGKIAYMFVLNKPDILNRVDLNFINIGRAQENTPFNLFIWKRLSDLPQDILAKRENQIVEPIKGFNLFQTIRLPDIAVADTFYIGWEQITSDFLVLGLDKNNDTGNRMFYNVDGTWQENNEVSGSFMIRPYFSASDVLVGFENIHPEENINIYPNPASEILHIKGFKGLLKLFHISGRFIGEWESKSGEISIDTSHLMPGIYILNYSAGRNSGSSKIIISR